MAAPYRITIDRGPFDDENYLILAGNGYPVIYCETPTLAVAALNGVLRTVRHDYDLDTWYDTDCHGNPYPVNDYDPEFQEQYEQSPENWHDRSQRHTP
jgi:hypothetical protein